MKYLIIFSVLLCSKLAIADLQPKPNAKPIKGKTGEIFYLINQLTFVEGQNSSPLIYRGTKSVSGEFLPHGWIGNCTATAVSKNVVFTAAHCVSNGKRITFSSRFDGKKYSATCSRHPKVNTRVWFNDYAFCKLDSEFPDDMVMATFATRTPEKGEKLLLNGYGAPNVGTHYWGNATVDRFGSQDIITCGPANLGGGDSGGSLLTWTEERSGKSGFEILGVNSRGGGGCSLFNRVSHPEFQSWAREYEKEKGVELCGISKECGIGVDFCPIERFLVKTIEQELKDAKEALNACLKAQ